MPQPPTDYGLHHRHSIDGNSLRGVAAEHAKHTSSQLDLSVQQGSEQQMTTTPGHLRLSFDILNLVLQDLATIEMAEPDVLNVQKLADDLQTLAGNANSRLSSDTKKEGEENGEVIIQTIVDENGKAIGEDAQLAIAPPKDPPPKVQFEANAMENGDLTASQQKLVDIFKEMDADGSGSLSTDELRKALLVIGVPPARLMKLIKLADKDDSGEIEEAEWTAAVAHPDMAEMHMVMEKMVTRTALTGGGLYDEPLDVPRFLLFPHSKRRIAWDLMVGLLCLYIAAMLPFISAFGDELPKHTTRALDNMDRIINYIFLFDILLNFRTAYAKEDGEYVMEPKAIITHYLRTWFPLDFISSFPFEDVSDGNMIDLQAAKLLKLSKLARVFRFLRKQSSGMSAADFSDTLDDFVQNKWIQQLSRRGSVFFQAALVCHWLACGLKSVDEGLLSGYVPDANVSQEYLAALYWSMTTLTTVGYGDMIPTSDRERAYTTVAMVIGGGFYGYIVGVITSMVSTEDLNVSAYHDRMDLIHAWLDHHRIPMQKKRTVRRYFQAYLKEKSAVSESEIWNDLSPELQKQVGEYIVHENVMSNPLFDGMPQGVVVRMQSILRRVTMLDGNSITVAGESGTAMYIIIAGNVNRESENKSMISMGPGESFGEEIVLGISEHYDYTVTATDKTMMEMLLEDEFLNLFQAMPAVFDKMRANAFVLHPEWKQRMSAVVED